jgi:hypothetical protein
MGEKDVDVSKWSSTQLVDALQRGEVSISLAEALSNCDTSEVELEDYEESL